MIPLFLTALYAGDMTFVRAPRTAERAALPSELPSGPAPFSIERPKEAQGENIIRIADHVLKDKLREDADDNLKGMLAVITYAKERIGPVKIVLPKGVFRFRIGAKNDLVLSGMKDITIDGNGATLLFSYLKPEDANVNPLHCIRITSCERMRLHDLTFDWDWNEYPLASVAEVTAVDSENDRVRFRVYDMNDARKRQFDSCPSIFSDFQPFDYDRGAIGVHWVNSLGITSDANMVRRWGSTAKKFFEDDTSWNGDKVTMHLVKEKRAWLQSFVRPGFQYLVRHYIYNTGTFWINANTNITLENITIHGSPGMGLRGGEGNGHHTHLSNVRIMNKPGTYGKRYCTAVSDGMNFGSTGGYLLIENCHIENNLDDGINIHDKIHVNVTFTPGSRELTLNDFQWRTPFDVGDTIEIQMPDRKPLSPPCTAVVTEKKIVPKSGAVNRYAVLTLDRDLPAIAADQKKLYVLNRSYNSGNFIIRNTTITGNKGRGMLLQSPNGLVENCHIFGNRKHALDLETEMTSSWGEGYAPENIVIRGCRLENSNIETVWNQHRQSPVIRIGAVVGEYSKPEDDLAWGIIRSILIVSNVIAGYPSAAMQITACKDLIVADNIFQNATRECAAGRSYNGAVIVKHGEDLQILNNRFAGPNIEQPGVFIDTSRTDASSIMVRGNTAAEDIIVPESDTAKISLAQLAPSGNAVLRITFRTRDTGGMYRVADGAGLLTPTTVDTYSAAEGTKEITFPFRAPRDVNSEMKLSFTCIGKNASSKNFFLVRYDGSANGAFRIAVENR